MLKEVKLVGLDSSGVELDFFLSVNNPNSFDLNMTGYSYDVKIMALPLANGASRETIVFYSKSVTEFLVPAKIPYKALGEVLRRFPNPDAIPYQFHSDLTFDSSLGNMSIPISNSGTVAIPKELYPSNILKKIGNLLKGLEQSP
jgi:LEA14-like dessication related protein